MARTRRIRWWGVLLVAFLGVVATAWSAAAAGDWYNSSAPMGQAAWGQYGGGSGNGAGQAFPSGAAYGSSPSANPVPSYFYWYRNSWNPSTTSQGSGNGGVPGLPAGSGSGGNGMSAGSSGSGTAGAAAGGASGGNTTGRAGMPGGSSGTVGRQPAPGADSSASVQEVVDFINQQRAAQGLPPLQLDPALCAVAQQKAEDMLVNDYFGHYSPTYGSPYDMLDSAGIQYRWAGENLAQVNSVEQGNEMFMESSGHRANILSSAYTKVGVAVVKKGGQYLIVEEFIKP